MKPQNFYVSLKEIISESMSFMLQKSYVSEGLKGCAKTVSEKPVDVEPAFKPYRLMDFGKQEATRESSLYVQAGRERQLVYLSVWLSRNDEYDSKEAFKALVCKLGALGNKFSVTLQGNKKRISFVVGVQKDDVIPAKTAVRSAFPNCEIGTIKGNRLGVDFSDKEKSLVFREFFTLPPYWRVLASAEANMVAPVLSCLSGELEMGEAGFYELIIQPCRNDWANNIFNLGMAERDGGVPLHVSQDWRQAGFTQEFSEKALQKNNKQMLAVIIRVGAFCSPCKAEAVIKSLSLSLGSLLWGGQKLSYLTQQDFIDKIGQENTEEMILFSKAYRAGSLLSIDEAELLTPVPLKEDIRNKRFSIDSSVGLALLQDCFGDKNGVFIGYRKEAGRKVPVYQGEEYRARGTVIRGGTGSGKTYLDAQMIGSDLQNRRRFLKDGSGKKMSIVVLDQCNDLYRVGRRKIRKEDGAFVYIFDPTIPGYVPAYNTVKLNPGENIDQKADNRAHHVKSFFPANEWSAHIEHIFKNAFYLLFSDPNAVFTDLWQLLDRNDEAKLKRKLILDTVCNEEVHRFWESEFRDTDKAKISLIQRKISSLLTDQRIQNIFSVKENKFAMQKIINESGILFSNLAEGELGTDAARFLEGCQVDDVIEAAKNRVTLSSEDIKKIPLLFYIDEIAKCPPKAFKDFTVSMRKCNVSLILSYHFDEQLTEELQAGIRNLGTTILLRQDYKQAKGQAFPQFMGRIDPNEFIDLDPGEGFIITPDSNITKFRSTMPQDGQNEDVIKKVIERNLKENYVAIADLQKDAKKCEVRKRVSRMGEEI